MVIQADGDVPHGEIVKVVGAVGQVEGITVHLGVQEPRGHYGGAPKRFSEGPLANWDVFHSDRLELARARPGRTGAAFESGDLRR